AVERSREESVHLDPFRMRMMLLREMDREQAIVPYAREFLASRAAWSPDPNGDGALVAFAALYRAGALSRHEFVASRSAWLARSQEKSSAANSSRTSPVFRWMTAYADAALTPEDAEEALAALSVYSPLPS